MSDDSIRVITETNVVRVTEEPIIVRVSAVGARGPVGPPGSVQSVNGDAGPFVVLDATDVGADPVGTASAEVAAFAATLAPVATSGDYADLIGVPTNVSAFANDAGYVDALGAAALEALAQAGMAHVTGWSVGLVVIGAPGDPVFDAAPTPDVILLGLDEDWEAELEFAS
ncbi:MAG: hypothetical protein HRU13_09735, partial [Phycisphaerales bacterium]|nr:hypothetical protein [Phycisphaerales bacterium]